MWPNAMMLSSFIQPLVNARDARCASAGFVDLDHRARHADVALRDFELAGHVHQKAMQRLVGTKSDHRVVRPGHPDIGLKGRAFGQDALISGRHMRVRAQDGRDAAVEIATHGLLLGRGFTVDVDDDDPGVDVVQLAIRAMKRVLARGHEDVAHELQHRHAHTARGMADDLSLARISGWIVRRPNDMLVSIVVVDEFLLVPDVISGGEGVDGQLPQLLHDGLGHSKAAGGVLDVDDREVDLLAIDDVLQLLMQGPPAGLADDVADVEDADHAVAQSRGCAVSRWAGPRDPATLRPRNLLRIINRPHLSDHSHLDLPGVLQLRFDLAGDILRQPDGLLVADLFGVDDDAKLAPGLNGEALRHSVHGVGNRFQSLEAVHVVLEDLAAR